MLVAACAGGERSMQRETPTAADGGPAPPTTVTSGQGTTAPAGPGAQVPEILDFEATLVGGRAIGGAELAGAPVAIWFWAPW